MMFISYLWHLDKIILQAGHTGFERDILLLSFWFFYFFNIGHLIWYVPSSNVNHAMMNKAAGVNPRLDSGWMDASLFNE